MGSPTPCGKSAFELSLITYCGLFVTCTDVVCGLQAHNQPIMRSGHDLYFWDDEGTKYEADNLEDRNEAFVQVRSLTKALSWSFMWLTM